MNKTLVDMPLLVGLSEGEREALINCGAVKNYGKGAIILNEGDNTHSMYVILSGRVKVYLSDEEGNEVILNTLGTGDYFGELSLLDEAPRSASVVTLEPCRLLILSEANFKQLLASHPDVAFQVLKDLIQRVRRLSENVRSLALLDVYGRVARTLLDLATEVNGKLMVTERLTHKELASRVGASREMVTRILRDLVVGGYIQMENKYIVICKRLPSEW
jgi:CRP/FNR family cyclic AMP-dependent transcriptional regulator